MARKLASIKDKPKTTNLKDSFRALVHIPRFIKEISQVSPTMFGLSIFARLISALSPVVVLWIGKLIIDEIILATKTQDHELNHLWWLIGIEVGLMLITNLISKLISMSDGFMGDLYSNASSVKIIRKTKEINISDLENSDFYDKLERARTQTSSRVNLMSNTLSQLQDLIMIGSLIAGLIYFEPWLILILIVSIIPSFINEIKFSSKKYSISRSWTAERRELDYLRYIGANDKTAKEVKLFGLTDWIADKFEKLSHEYYLINRKLTISRSIYGFIFDIIGTLAYYGAYVFIVLRVVANIISIGDLTFLAGSFRRLRNSLTTIFSRFTRISESSLYLKDYFDFLDLEVEQEGANALPVPDKIKEGISFENLSFSYPGSNEMVLKNVNFKIQAGEKVAFVGQNGAGKTTLIKLLLRFYEPTSGRITIDGTNINEFDREAYQKWFGVIFQDFLRYEFTIKENIGVGSIDDLEDTDRIHSAAEQSLADSVISQVEQGINQQLGRRFANGKDLSGGQWQKIALARAYMKDAEVMILDEPTSALDARAEYEAFQRFIGLTEGKTSIIISHRFSTVRMADKIVVLEDGLISESGTHEQLMSVPKLYAELFELQAAGYQ